MFLKPPAMARGYPRSQISRVRLPWMRLIFGYKILSISRPSGGTLVKRDRRTNERPSRFPVCRFI